MPPWDVARSFAVESEFHQPTLGMHKPWPYINQDVLYQLMKGYDRRAFEEAAARWGKKAKPRVRQRLAA
jgi:hypothetical protein